MTHENFKYFVYLKQLYLIIIAFFNKTRTNQSCPTMSKETQIFIFLNPQLYLQN